MRICLVSETWPPDINGVAHTLNQLTGVLLARGETLQLVHPALRLPRHRVPVPGLQHELQVRSVALPGYREVRLGLPAGRRLQRLWQAQRPDVIYLATQGPLGWSARRTARRLGVPMVAGWHTNFDHYCRAYGLPWLESGVRRGLRRFHNGCAATLVPTHAQCAQLERQGFARLAVMGRGIDGECFSPAHRDSALRRHWGVDDHQPVALYVGRPATRAARGALHRLSAPRGTCSALRQRRPVPVPLAVRNLGQRGAGGHGQRAGGGGVPARRGGRADRPRSFGPGAAAG